MKSSVTKEELQSRRQFFKSAAKAALPVIGAVVLSSLPIKVKATPTGCDGSCYGGCTGSCTGSCTVRCVGACMDNCSGSCSGSCSGTCASTSSY